jgi:hypothetical protein
VTSTACGSGENSNLEEISLPYHDNPSSLVTIDKGSLPLDTSIVVTDTEVPLRKEQILRMFRKAEKVKIPTMPPLKKSGS